MTLQDLRDHLVKQVLCFQAYFNTDDADGKTAKAYRKSVKEAQDRLDLIEKILLDGYTPDKHDSPVTTEPTGDEKP